MEKELKAGEAPETLPVAQVRKAWRACESLWVQQLRTIARQMGGNWGGKLGQDIEAFAVRLHTEMLKRMAADPILSGAVRLDQKKSLEG